MFVFKFIVPYLSLFHLIVGLLLNWGGLLGLNVVLAVDFGVDEHHGDGDASMNIAAEVPKDEPGAATLHITVRDDVAVDLGPGQSPSEMIGRDHLEVWWCADAPCVSGERSGLRQLGIARSTNDTMKVMWLFPADVSAPLPTISGDWQHLTITLQGLAHEPAPRLFDDQTKVFPLSVVYSDADDGVGQQTLIATSDLQWANVETFGRLVVLDNEMVYPNVGLEVEPD